MNPYQELSAFLKNRKFFKLFKNSLRNFIVIYFLVGSEFLRGTLVTIVFLVVIIARVEFFRGVIFDCVVNKVVLRVRWFSLVEVIIDLRLRLHLQRSYSCLKKMLLYQRRYFCYFSHGHTRISFRSLARKLLLQTQRVPIFMISCIALIQKALKFTFNSV